MKIQIPAFILFIFGLIQFLALISLIIYPIAAFFGDFDFSVNLCISGVMFIIILNFVYYFFVISKVSMKTRSDLCFLKWSYQKFFNLDVFKPKLLPGEAFLIQETQCFVRKKGIFENDHIATVFVTDKRVILTSFIPANPDRLFQKYVFWYSGKPDSSSSGFFWNFVSADFSDYSCFQDEDDAGIYFRIITHKGLSKSEFYVYHPQAEKIFGLLTKSSARIQSQPIM
jgi:hypothetical protein